eukprot:1189622-Prorocentrum_minimum.AAC.1
MRAQPETFGHFAAGNVRSLCSRKRSVTLQAETFGHFAGGNVRSLCRQRRARGAAGRRGELVPSDRRCLCTFGHFAGGGARVVLRCGGARAEGPAGGGAPELPKVPGGGAAVRRRRPPADGGGGHSEGARCYQEWATD